MRNALVAGLCVVFADGYRRSEGGSYETYGIVYTADGGSELPLIRYRPWVARTGAWVIISNPVHEENLPKSPQCGWLESPAAVPSVDLSRTSGSMTC